MWLDPRGLNYELLGLLWLGLLARKSLSPCSDLVLLTFTREHYKWWSGAFLYSLSSINLCCCLSMIQTLLGVFMEMNPSTWSQINWQNREHVLQQQKKSKKGSPRDTSGVLAESPAANGSEFMTLKTAVIEGADSKKRHGQHEMQVNEMGISGGERVDDKWVLSDCIMKTDLGLQESGKSRTGSQQERARKSHSRPISPHNVSFPAFPRITTPPHPHPCPVLMQILSHLPSHRLHLSGNVPMSAPNSWISQTRWSFLKDFYDLEIKNLPDWLVYPKYMSGDTACLHKWSLCLWFFTRVLAA